MMPMPAYDEMIAMFDLDILRKPGDLSVVNGDFAIHDGDLKLGSDAYNAMYRLAQRWRFHAPALGALCETVFDAPKRKQQAEADMAALMQTRPGNGWPLTRDPERNRRFHEINDAMGAGELGIGAYAGTVMVVMDAMLRRYWRDVKAGEASWRTTGPLFAGQSFGVLVQAAGNNFRHHDEWRRTSPPTPMQEKSKQPLRELLSRPGEPPPDLGQNVCASVAFALAGGDGFIGLSRALFAFAKGAK